MPNKKKPQRRVTMADLARRAGLSKSTISRALAGDPRVNPQTRARVEALARELGYEFHPLASGLATNRTYTIGLGIPSPPRSFSNPFYLEFAGGVGDCALNQGYTLFFAQNEDILARTGGRRRTVAALADGYILTEPEVGDPRIERLIEMGKPFVFLGSVRPGDDSSWKDDAVVWTEADNVQGCKEVVQHLIQLGHRRIACITGTERHVATHNRLQGYKEALSEAGIPLDDELIETGDFTEEGGYQAARRLLGRRPDVTAIFASNDLMAFGALHAARERGLNVPRDISVAGFDGITTFRYSTPQLTTAEQPIYELGQAAAKLLIDQIQGNKLTEQHVLFPCKLRVGDSTGRLRA